MLLFIYMFLLSLLFLSFYIHKCKAAKFHVTMGIAYLVCVFYLGLVFTKVYRLRTIRLCKRNCATRTFICI